MLYAPSHAWDTTQQQSLHAEWVIAGKCRSPVWLRQEGRGHAVLQHGVENVAGHARYEPPRALDLALPCRQCPECLWARRLLWGRRAVTEYKQSPRTWFGTLTVNPVHRYKLIAETDVRLAANGETLRGLKPKRQFAELHRTTGAHVTKYLKRIRKGNITAKLRPGRFRFMLTTEPHKDWFPHYHILVSEVTEFEPVTYDMLSHPWDLGFGKFNLVNDSKAAWYAAKYLGKFSMARVRVSKRYGEPVQALSIGANRVSTF